MKRLAAVASGVAVVATSVLAAAPAQAYVMDTDSVYAYSAGDVISGSVSWRNYYSGFGTVTIYNQMTDGVCATGQQRVMRAGVWSAWTTIGTVCTVPSYTANVWVSSNNQVVNNWQFRIRDANSAWIYDNNFPGAPD